MLLVPPTRKMWDFSLRVLVSPCPVTAISSSGMVTEKDPRKFTFVPACFLQFLTPLQNLPVPVHVPEPSDTWFFAFFPPELIVVINRKDWLAYPSNPGGRTPLPVLFNCCSYSICFPCNTSCHIIPCSNYLFLFVK